MLTLLRIVVCLAAAAAAAPYVAREIRAPRLLEPTPDSELTPVCKACRHQLRSDQRWVQIDRELLRGHCPRCRNRVPAWPAWGEVATLLVAAVVGWRITEWAWLPAFLVFAFTLVAVVAIDARLHLIPTRLVYPATLVSAGLLAFAALATGDPHRLLTAGVGAFASSLFLWLLVLISPAGMGAGDARLALLLGLFLGWHGWREVLFGLFVGFLLGAIGGLLLMLRGRGSRKSLIAFGPYLAAAGLLVALWPALASVLDFRR